MTTIVMRDSIFFRGLDWPEDAVMAAQDHRGTWHFTTRADLRQRKIETMERNLRYIREEETQRRPIYVWVFWCPGLGGFAYKGWWVYLVGRGIECGKYFEHDERMMARLMELFPLVEPTLFGPPSIEDWKIKFSKQYQRGRHCGKPQGKAAVWAEVRGSSVVEILGRAEWVQKGDR